MNTESRFARAMNACAQIYSDNRNIAITRRYFDEEGTDSYVDNRLEVRENSKFDTIYKYTHFDFVTILERIGL